MLFKAIYEEHDQARGSNTLGPNWRHLIPDHTERPRLKVRRDRRTVFGAEGNQKI